MSSRSSKMLMMLAEKNEHLKTQLKKSKKIKKDFQNIDPEYFGSESDTTDSEQSDSILKRKIQKTAAESENTSITDYFVDSPPILGPQAQRVETLLMDEGNVSQHSTYQVLDTVMDGIGVLDEESQPSLEKTENYRNISITDFEVHVEPNVRQNPTVTERCPNQINPSILYDCEDDFGITEVEETHTESTDTIIPYTQRCPNQKNPSVILNRGDDLGKEVEDTSTETTTIVYTKAGKLRQRRTIDQTVEERKKEKQQQQCNKHTVQPPCNCKKKCTEIITNEQRLTINNAFWELSANDRSAFMLHHTSSEPVKRRTVTIPSEPENQFKREKTYKYYLKTENGDKRSVCKKFFLGTLGYVPTNDKALMKALQSKDTVRPPIDTRGKTQPPHNKIDDGPIIDHIQSYKPSISHYRREHAPNRLYLPSDLTIFSMHKEYNLKNPDKACSYDKYRAVFKKMNIAIVKLGHEECERCEGFNLHEHGEESLNDDCDNCNAWKTHIEKAAASRRMYDIDAESDVVPGRVIFSADLQKIIMLPRLEMFKSVIFTNRLIAYNECFVPVGKKQKGLNVCAMLWHEAISGRSCDDLVSTYFAFFKANRDSAEIIIWVDNCSSQNKNWTFFSFLIWIINSNHISAQKITIKYFEAGHTFMSADSFHHNVELSMARMRNRIYDFEDFCTAVGTSRKNVKVKEMAVEDFFTFQDLTSQYKLSKMSPRPYVSNFVEVAVERNSVELFYKNDHTEDAKKINVLLKKFNIDNLTTPVPKENPTGVRIQKKEGIIRHLGSLMPNRLGFWKNLPETPDLLETV